MISLKKKDAIIRHTQEQVDMFNFGPVPPLLNLWKRILLSSQERRSSKAGSSFFFFFFWNACVVMNDVPYFQVHSWEEQGKFFHLDDPEWLFYFFLCHRSVPGLPNHQRWCAKKWKLSRNVYTFHARLCTFGADLHAQLVIFNIFFLRPSSVGSLLRVRRWLGSN